jgi:hypothetical protein
MGALVAIGRLAFNKEATMATITPKDPTLAGIAAPFVASTVSGDQVEYKGGDLLIEINNGHSAPITVNIAPTKATGVIPGAGIAPVPTRSLAVANAAHGVFLIKASEVRAYLNANRRIPLTYTSGNVALTVRAFTV